MIEGSGPSNVNVTLSSSEMKGDEMDAVATSVNYSVESCQNLFVNNVSSVAKLEALAEGDFNELTVFLEGNGTNLSSLHPRILKAEIARIVPDSKVISTVRITRQGKIIVVTSSTQAASNLMKMQSIAGIQVTGSIQFDNISTKFLLFNIPQDVSCLEIAEELTESGITPLEVRRFIRRAEGQATPSRTVLVTKLGILLPSDIKLWYQNHRIALFVDRPRQCPKCHNFSHNPRTCRSLTTCKKCSESHEGPCMAINPLCSNCKGAHEADDKSCPEYVREVELLKYKCQNNLSIAEARRLFRVKQVEGRTTYSSVTSHSAPVASGASPPSQDCVTKAVFENTLAVFLDTLAGMIQSALEAQLVNFNQMLQTTLGVIKAKQDQMEVIVQKSMENRQKSNPFLEKEVARKCASSSKKPRKERIATEEENSEMELGDMEQFKNQMLENVREALNNCPRVSLPSGKELAEGLLKGVNMGEKLAVDFGGKAGRGLKVTAPVLSPPSS